MDHIYESDDFNDMPPGNQISMILHHKLLDLAALGHVWGQMVEAKHPNEQDAYFDFHDAVLEYADAVKLREDLRITLGDATPKTTIEDIEESRRRREQ